MIRICVCNQKGGVGKTTTAINLSAYLALRGRRVLLIDTDPQAAATSGLGIENPEVTIYDVLVDGRLDEAITETEVEGLRLVPSSVDLAGAEIELANEVGREFLLRDVLDGLEGYDYIVVDSPPSLGILTLNGIIACGNVLVPIQAEYYALEGLAQLLNTTKLIEKRLRIPIKTRFLITMYDTRTKLSEEVKRQVLEHLGDRVFKTVIPRNVKLAEAPSFGKPIALYAPDSKGAIAYRKLAEEVDGVEW